MKCFGQHKILLSISLTKSESIAESNHMSVISHKEKHDLKERM